MTDPRRVTVVVATRNRGAGIIPTITSILLCDYPAFDLLVLDQSVDDRTALAVRPFCEDTRFHYLRSATKGLGRAHNIGIAMTSGELIALTDDDCVVPPDWLNAIVDAFAADEHVGIVFGRVFPCDYDVAAGYVPVFEHPRPTMLRNRHDDLAAGLGIGACLAIRRDVWRDVQGFDEQLGPGASLGSLEDRDMAIRVLLAGYYISYTPSVYVTHHGFRTNSQLRYMAFRDWLGFGSCCAKYLKCGQWGLSYYMLHQMWIGQAVSQAIRHWQTRKRIGRVTPIASFWLGFVAGFIAPVNHRTLRFTHVSRDSVYSDQDIKGLP